MALKTDWAAGNAGLVAWMNDISTIVNQNTDGTGKRNIANLLVNGYTLAANGFIRIERIGPRVYLSIKGLVGPGTGTATYLSGLPVGWRPVSDEYRRPLGDGQSFTIGAAGSLGAPITVATSTSSAIELEWMASGTFPAVVNYPGTAV